MLSNDHRDALQTWALAVLPRATAYARSLARDTARAEDLVQECLYQLLRRSDRYDLIAEGIPLLFRAISNRCITQAARERGILSLDPSTDRQMLELADPQSWEPELQARGRELQLAIQKGLEALPEMQRAAVELRALGMDREQIAGVLEVSLANAAVLLFRGRKALAAALGLNMAPEKKSDSL